MTSPLEDSLVLVIGPSFPALMHTNVGGWCNIEENSQSEGDYLVIVLKFGYHIVVDLVNYAGDPIQKTIEMNKW